MSMVFYYQINLKFAHILHINNKIMLMFSNQGQTVEKQLKTGNVLIWHPWIPVLLVAFSKTLSIYIYGVYYIQYPEREEFSKPWRLYLHFYWCRSREKLYLME